MSDNPTITKLDPPLPCCRQLAVQRRCGELATLAQVTRLADGSYHMQPFCAICAKAYQIAPKEHANA